MEKLYNDKGQVGVAISYGYGGGWSTWNDVSPLDKSYNELILNKDWEAVKKLIEEDGNEQYTGGLTDCEIVWLDEGTPFYISEYDGSESLETSDRLTSTA